MEISVWNRPGRVKIQVRIKHDQSIKLTCQEVKVQYLVAGLHRIGKCCDQLEESGVN